MIRSLHIEPTSRCTLACPGCERTILINKFKKKALSIDDLQHTELDKFIDMDVQFVKLSGNLGDPIYHKDLPAILQVLKNKGIKVYITTNGSHRSEKWWDSILTILDKDDKITFSIDGTFENNKNYRLNTDELSLNKAIEKCVNADVYTKWKYIVFNYNQHSIDDAKKLSLQIGIDEFFIDISDRWDKNTEKFKPSGYIGSRDKVQTMYKDSEKNLTVIDIEPRCSNHSEHFISSDGFYTPCCYSKHHDFYYKSEWWKQKNDFDISKTTLSRCIEYFEDFYKKIHTERPNYCVFNCGKCE